MAYLPKVSIGLPVYNGEAYIQNTIDSILSQSFTDFELIISDNASTDETEKICREYADKDPRVRYYRVEQNRGAAWNFNRVFELSVGQYFKWAAHDDICAPNFLSELVPVLEENEEVVLCFPKSSRNINSAGEVVEDWFITEYGLISDRASQLPSGRFRHILFSSIWCLEFFGLFRTSALRRIYLLQRSKIYGHFGGSDKVLLARLSLLGQFYSIEKDLFYRRFHPNQMTALSNKERKKRIDPNLSTLVPDSFRAVLGYIQAIYAVPLGVQEKMACCIVVMQLFFQPDKFRKIFLPGPNNYFGIDFGTKRSA
jgi:glycosyltransferase involved in cell wall biosynthesis